MNQFEDPFGEIDRDRAEAAGDNIWHSDQASTPRSGIKKALWIVTLIFGGAFFCCICCCGGCFINITNQMAEEVADDLQDHPVIQEHIGEIESCQYNYADNFSGENQGEKVFRLTGTKGTGVIKIITQLETGNRPISGRLILPDGTEIELDIEPPEEELPLPSEEESKDLEELEEEALKKPGDPAATENQQSAEPEN